MRFQVATQSTQQFVTGQMPERIVELLEIVDVGLAADDGVASPRERRQPGLQVAIKAAGQANSETGAAFRIGTRPVAHRPPQTVIFDNSPSIGN